MNFLKFYAILRDILKEYIPENIFNQPKSGFSIPVGEWIRNELRDDFVATLNDKFLNKIPNFNIKLFKQMFNQHMNKKGDYSSFIFRVFIFAKWCKEFDYLK